MHSQSQMDIHVGNNVKNLNVQLLTQVDTNIYVHYTCAYSQHTVTVAPTHLLEINVKNLNVQLLTQVDTNVYVHYTCAYGQHTVTVAPTHVGNNVKNLNAQFFIHAITELLTEVCEILQIFRGDLMKFCEIFMKITFKLTYVS